MTVKTVTYYSFNANPAEAWMAYVVLNTGKRWWVYSMEATEEEAVAKITALYEAEVNKYKDLPVEEKQVNEHHLAGKVWMIHKETRDKKRIALTEIALYEQNGYVRGGPRSK